MQHDGAPSSTEPDIDPARAAHHDDDASSGHRSASALASPHASPSPRSRRQVLGLGAFRAALAAGAGAAIATSARPARAQDSSVLSVAGLDADPTSLLEKLVDRITFGATEAELTLARTLGYEGYLEHHLNPAAIDDSACDARLATFTTLSQAYSQLIPQSSGLVRNQLVDAAVLRAVYSRRQLFERMVELWTDHFNIDIAFVQQYKTVDDRDVVRANALGTFPALLNASARSPAMLYYLNNNVSTAGNPNENYARELMELHTLGVDGGYTQQDVQQVARCLTGWTIWPSSAGAALYGTFRYNNANHDQGAKTVLGTPIPANGGQNDGVLVLNMLINHPSTARTIATKLCRYFLGYNVSPAVIDRVAQVYTQTGGDIKQMLRTTLRPEHLASAPPKLKRPFHLFVSALRSVNAEVSSVSTVRSRLGEAGHAPFAWSTPDGYPDKLDHWGSNVIVRWNFGASLMSGLSGVTVDDVSFYTGATTAEQMADRINQRLFLGRMPAAERNRIRDYLLPNTPTTTRRREAIGLGISSPGFQWY